jgi:HD superfamily phosphohydrolase YqeK
VTGTEIELPEWAIASPKRRAHIARVTALVLAWARAMHLDEAERDAWRDAARWHDALRDATESELRAIVPELDWPAALLHGPAAAKRLSAGGEKRTGVLEAIYWHTVGNERLDRTGRALYMADFLEPGRSFDRDERAELATAVVDDFDGTYRKVVRRRLADRMAAGEAMLPETTALWASVR